MTELGRHVPETFTADSGVTVATASIHAATVANLKALGPSKRSDGMQATVAANRSRWIFDADSAAVDTTDNLVISPDVGGGAWLRVDPVVHMKIAISYETADAATLFTVPAGFRLELEKLFWEITANFTGGTSSAIGISSADAPHETQGDLLGGAGGDVAATLVAATGETQGTIGVSFSAAPLLAVLEATDTIRFDRIVSAFTAGTGFVHVVARVIS